MIIDKTFKGEKKMKKRNLAGIVIIGALLIGALALTGCGKTEKNDKKILCNYVKKKISQRNKTV